LARSDLVGQAREIAEKLALFMTAKRDVFAYSTRAGVRQFKV
jgi:hypothetical protein